MRLADRPPFPSPDSHAILTGGRRASCPASERGGVDGLPLVAQKAAEPAQRPWQVATVVGKVRDTHSTGRTSKAQARRRTCALWFKSGYALPMLRLVAVLPAFVTVLAVASPASARSTSRTTERDVQAAVHAVIDEAGIKGARPLRIRCIRDACDRPCRHHPKIIASILALDRVFQSFAAVLSRVQTVRQ